MEIPSLTGGAHLVACSSARRGRRAALVAAALCAGLLGVATPVGAATPAPAGGSRPAVTAPLHYTALGDSYASGPNIPTQLTDPKGCDRSSHNYAHDIAADLGLSLTDVSCSGATTTDVLGPQTTSTGTNPAQIDSVTATDSLVTITVGGDNLGFTSIIENCVAATPDGPVLGGIAGGYFNCKNYYDPTGTANGTTLAAAISAIEPKIATVLQDIHDRAPFATVVLVGYPDILPNTSTGCWPTMPFTTTDAPYLNTIETKLDAMLTAVAAANGALYIDTYTPSRDYNACTASTVRWVSPIDPTATSYPVHPNKHGETDMAMLAEPVVATSLAKEQTSGTVPQPAGTHGYWLVGSDGGIFSFGSAVFHGSTGAMTLQRPVVGITPTATDNGYWLVATDGGIFAFGNAVYHGSIPGLGIAPAGSTGPGRHLNEPIVGMVPTVDKGGYLMVASDGGVFAFGDADFAGSCPALAHGCDAPAVAVVPDATGDGYWVVTQTGSVYAFGDAPYEGSVTGASAPITAAVRTPDGKGYWILDAVGNVYAFGDAESFGTAPAGTVTTGDRAVAIVATSDGGGYWVVLADGAVWDVGDAPSDGSMAGHQLNAPIIASTGW